MHDEPWPIVASLLGSRRCRDTALLFSKPSRAGENTRKCLSAQKAFFTGFTLIGMDSTLTRKALLKLYQGPLKAFHDLLMLHESCIKGLTRPQQGRTKVSKDSNEALLRPYQGL